MSKSLESPDYNLRLNRVRKRMASAGLQALLVSEPHNIYYLCGSNGGYTGAKTALIIDNNRSVLFIDQRYIYEARKSARADCVYIWKTPGYTDLLRVFHDTQVSSIGFEESHITVKQFKRMDEEFDGINMTGVSDLVEKVREIKDPVEIEMISKAAAIADKAFENIISIIKPGLCESEIALELDYFMQKNGAQRPSFDTIIASGPNSAVPHATTSNKKIKAGDLVKMDFGAVVEGYHSDMTRTVVIGKANKEQKKIYGIVQQAQAMALESVSPGRVSGDIDAKARDFIEKEDYAEYFIHNLGHGVGLQVHESPRLGKECEAILEPGMTVTVEPGIYINGFGGIRIEDLVVVTDSGRRMLSRSTKELLEI